MQNLFLCQCFEAVNRSPRLTYGSLSDPVLGDTPAAGA